MYTGATPRRLHFLGRSIAMMKFSSTLKFAALSAALLLAACTHKQEAVNTAPPPAAAAAAADSRACHVQHHSGQRPGFQSQCRRHRPFRLQPVQYRRTTTRPRCPSRRPGWRVIPPSASPSKVMRRARHPRIQSRAGCAPRQCGEGISGRPGRRRRPSGNRLLWQGASDLHRVRVRIAGRRIAAASASSRVARTRDRRLKSMKGAGGRTRALFLC